VEVRQSRLVHLLEACYEELTIANIEDSSIDSFTEKLIAIAEKHHSKKQAT